MKKTIVAVAFLLACAAANSQNLITSPEQAFGFKPGTDRKLADWGQLTAYFKTFGTQLDRIRYEEVGKTTEGRPLVTVTISSAENISHLVEYQDI